MDFLEQHNLLGLVIGISTFLIIGLFHPIVIKGEYHFGTRCWWAFLILGIICGVFTIVVENGSFPTARTGEKRLVPQKS